MKEPHERADPPSYVIRERQFNRYCSRKTCNRKRETPVKKLGPHVREISFVGWRWRCAQLVHMAISFIGILFIHRVITLITITSQILADRTERVSL